MLSVSFLCLAMILTYRVISFGFFLAPGGVLVFPLTYIFADIVAETYGYRNAKLLILGNYFCIVAFNIVGYLLIQLPVPPNVLYEEIFDYLFAHAFTVTFAYGLGFLFGDLINAYVISKWQTLVKGKYFVMRSVGSSIIGLIIFNVVASITIYSSQLSLGQLARQFLTTITIKAVVIILLAYPAYLVVILLRKSEKLQPYDITQEPDAFSVFSYKELD